MKINLLVLGLGLGAAILGGCNDDLSLVGPSIQPPEDGITVYNDTFRIEATTVLMDGVYARTDSAMLGEIYDPLYGELKSDYMCQFYCPENYKFAKTPIDGKIDSVNFKIFYGSSIGDTLVPMKAELFLISKPLEKNFYTNFDPQKYCDMQTVMGSKVYTAYNQSIPDSIRENGYAPHVAIKLPKEFGQKLYDETIQNPASFSSQEAFNKFLPGFYVTTTYGTGNILNISGSYIDIFYKYMTKTEAGKDSIVSSFERFNVTKEVIQLSRFKNSDIEQLLKPNDEYTYIKSPAGVCTRLVIPSKDLAPILEGRILNNLPLTLYAMPQENWKFAFDPAPNLLLLPEDSVKTFFEERQIENGTTSFLASYNTTTLTYSFNNISELLKHQLKNDKDHDLRLLAIPVKRTTTTTGSYNNQTTRTTAIENYMAPSGSKLRKDKEVTQMVVTSCKYN